MYGKNNNSYITPFFLSQQAVNKDELSVKVSKTDDYALK
ncbi:MAG: hypothetical protein ACJAYF_001197 [Arenicella sp.]|jgi:hypothetical protein